MTWVLLLAVWGLAIGIVGVAWAYRVTRAEWALIVVATSGLAAWVVL